MATTTTKLKTKFKDASGQEQTFTLNYANAAAGAAVRPLMEGMIANGAIYDTAPATIVSAAFVTTTETPVSL